MRLYALSRTKRISVGVVSSRNAVSPDEATGIRVGVAPVNVSVRIRVAVDIITDQAAIAV